MSEIYHFQPSMSMMAGAQPIAIQRQNGAICLDIPSIEVGSGGEVLMRRMLKSGPITERISPNLIWLSVRAYAFGNVHDQDAANRVARNYDIIQFSLNGNSIFARRKMVKQNYLYYNLPKIGIYLYPDAPMNKVSSILNQMVNNTILNNGITIINDKIEWKHMLERCDD